MSFVDAIKSVFTQYVGFSGRARRSEFWYFYLFTILLSIVASILQRAMTNSTNGIVTAIVGLAIVLPSLAVAVRRLHDTSRSGWWLLIGLIPVVGTIILIVFWVQDSHGDNQYGPSPKAVGSTAAPVDPSTAQPPEPHGPAPGAGAAPGRSRRRAVSPQAERAPATSDIRWDTTVVTPSSRIVTP